MSLRANLDITERSLLFATVFQGQEAKGCDAIGVVLHSQGDGAASFGPSSDLPLKLRRHK